jgi:hypothetical protein
VLVEAVDQEGLRLVVGSAVDTAPSPAPPTAAERT